MNRPERSPTGYNIGRTTKSSAKLVVFPISESSPLVHDAYGSPKDPSSLRRVAAYSSQGGVLYCINFNFKGLFYPGYFKCSDSIWRRV